VKMDLSGAEKSPAGFKHKKALVLDPDSYTE
jgi:hypothetical protein